MKFPEPTIDIEAEAAELFAAAGRRFGERADARVRFRALLAQAWEEGRWSPPGACMNPYGEPAAPPPIPEGTPWVHPPGQPLQRLREAAQAALAWVEAWPRSSPIAIAKQLRSALGEGGD